MTRSMLLFLLGVAASLGLGPAGDAQAPLGPGATPSPMPLAPLRIIGSQFQLAPLIPIVPGRIGGTVCCDDPRTTSVDEGLRDGWTLATDSALDKLAGAGLAATHFRTGPYSATGPPGLQPASERDRARARALEIAVRDVGPGTEILAPLRSAVQAANARGMYVEVDLVDNWALVNGWNFYGDNCAVTQGPPPERYLGWVQAVVASTGDLAVFYNLGNEGFRCNPKESWERGLHAEVKAALASHGWPTRLVGSQVLLPNVRVALDYRTLGGVFFAPPRMEIPVTLTEDDGGTHTPEEWWALVAEARRNGTYVMVWRGKMSDLEFDRALAGPPPSLAVSVGDARVVEGASGTKDAVFTVSLSGPSTSPVSVSYATTDGTAHAGSDFAAASGTVTFEPGATSKAISVAVTGDRSPEPNETFSLKLTAPVGAALGDSEGIATVVDDDDAADFDADGNPDLVWRHETLGFIGVWLMDGITRASEAAFTPGRVADTNWRIVGMADFNGDAKFDLLFQHQISGGLVVWYMDGLARTSGVALTPGQVDPSWAVAGTPDMSGDGKPDILFRHKVTGDLVVWYMDGVVRTRGVALNPSRADPAWVVAAIADLNGDGKPDLIWRHQVTGDLVIWHMSEAMKSSGVALVPSRVADLSWRIVGPK